MREPGRSDRGRSRDTSGRYRRATRATGRSQDAVTQLAHRPQWSPNWLECPAVLVALRHGPIGDGTDRPTIRSPFRPRGFAPDRHPLLEVTDA